MFSIEKHWFTVLRIFGKYYFVKLFISENFSNHAHHFREITKCSEYFIREHYHQYIRTPMNMTWKFRNLRKIMSIIQVSRHTIFCNGIAHNLQTFWYFKSQRLLLFFLWTSRCGKLPFRCVYHMNILLLFFITQSLKIWLYYAP